MYKVPQKGSLVALRPGKLASCFQSAGTGLEQTIPRERSSDKGLHKRIPTRMI